MSDLTVNQVDVAKLKVEPGDVLLITIPGPLTPQQAVDVRTSFEEAFKKAGGYVPSVFVINRGIEVSVVRAASLSKTEPTT